MQPTTAEACAHPSAKHLALHGRTGPVNAVEADGALFIQNDEAEAEAEAIHSKAMEPASEVVAPSKVAARTAAASEVAAPAVATAALDPEPCCATASPAVIKSNSFAAAISKPSLRPKPSAAASRLSADLKRSTAASKPAAAVPTPLEVNISYRNVHAQCTVTLQLMHGVCICLVPCRKIIGRHSSRATALYTAYPQPLQLFLQRFPFHCYLCSA